MSLLDRGTRAALSRLLRRAVLGPTPPPNPGGVTCPPRCPCRTVTDAPPRPVTG